MTVVIRVRKMQVSERKWIGPCLCQWGMHEVRVMLALSCAKNIQAAGAPRVRQASSKGLCSRVRPAGQQQPAH